MSTDNKKQELKNLNLNLNLNTKITNLENFLTNCDDNNIALKQLFNLYLSQGKYQDALKIVYFLNTRGTNDIENKFNYGVVLYYLKNYTIAIKVIKEILKENKLLVKSNYYLGLCFISVNQFEHALDHFKICLNIDEKFYLAYFSIGNMYLSLNNHSQALFYFNKSISINNVHIESIFNKAVCEKKLNLTIKAIDTYEKLLKLNPKISQIYFNLANIYDDSNDYNKAINYYFKAINLDNNYLYYYNIGLIFLKTNNNDQAIFYFLKSFEINPKFIHSLFNAGLVYLDIKDYNNALIIFEKVINIDLQYPYVLGYLLHCSMLLCKWDNYDEISSLILTKLKNEEKVIFPFAAQAFINDEKLLFDCAKIYCEDKHPNNILVLNDTLNDDLNNKRKIKIGYVCGEFKNHPTTQLLVEILENHDKNIFEIHGFDNGISDYSKIRKRIIKTFDYHHEIKNITDFDVFKIIKNHNINILINLNGYYGDARQNLFAMKPALVQINYLGFPGTTGSNYFDYIIADKITIPTNSQKFYSERVIHLPHCYQPNDSSKFTNLPPIKRADFNIPHDSFVYCCFNNCYKITPEIFSIWCNILNRTKNSVLLLISDSVAVQSNLTKEAIDRKVDLKRLVFTTRVPLSNHLARGRLCDLFLDTFPYNAHTTASDALFSGLPVLTLKGSTFPSRVSASLLNDLHLNDLVVTTLEEYENMAVNLATDNKIIFYKNYLFDIMPNYLKNHSSTYVKNLENIFIKLTKNKTQAF
jgi:protein O-GlcNAc transferase